MKFRTVKKGTLPEIGVEVLIWHNKMQCWVIGTRWPDRYRSKFYHWTYYSLGADRLEAHEVIHWQQLPPPPL